MALGDAVGVATEFLSKEKVEENYKWEEDWGPGREKVFCDTHRMTFPKGDWTDDTDQAIVLLRLFLYICCFVFYLCIENIFFGGICCYC